jgi:hypothetical protein
MYGDNVKSVPASTTYGLFFHAYSLSKDQITHTKTVVIGQYMIERNVTLLHNGELGSDHYDALLSSEGN